MRRDMEQMQLLMALSLYLNAIRNNPVAVLVPATPEMLFGSGANEQEPDESIDDYEYEYEEEEDDDDDEEAQVEEEFSPSTIENTPSNWKSGSRMTELGDENGAFAEKLSLVQPV